MKIVFRADDAGSSIGANEAILETVAQGVVRNISFMVPGPEFFHGVSLLKDLDVGFGLHVTLNAEWDDVKWAPVLAAYRVPSLVEPGGYFTQNPGILEERGYSVDEAMAEVVAQLAKARDAGLTISYLDEHMGVGRIKGLGPRLKALCVEEGLVFAGDLPYLREPDKLFAKDLDEGPWVAVFHPGADDDPVMASFVHRGLNPGQIHEERIRDRILLLDPRMREHVSLTYREAAADMS